MAGYRVQWDFLDGLHYTGLKAQQLPPWSIWVFKVLNDNRSTSGNTRVMSARRVGRKYRYKLQRKQEARKDRRQPQR